MTTIFSAVLLQSAMIAWFVVNLGDAEQRHDLASCRRGQALPT
jgi:hypothetical protein